MEHQLQFLVINYKNQIMKNIISILILLFSFASCKAQQEYPLNSNPYNLPNYSYVKDINNELNPYIGIYKSCFNGKQITLYIIKEIKRLFDYPQNKYYNDVLSIKFIVQNSAGQILQNTQNQNFSANQIQHTIYSMGVRSHQNSVWLAYGGTNCGVGNGRIILKKLNNTQLSWSYYPNGSTFVGNQCPSNLDTTIYLPEAENLVFTKQ